MKFKVIFKNIHTIFLSFFFLYVLIILLLMPFFFSFHLQLTLTSLTNPNNIEQTNTDFNSQNVLLAQKNLINFFSYNEELDSNFFSTFEIEHYYDVKELLRVLIVLFVGGVVYLISYFTYVFQTSSSTEKILLKTSSMLNYSLIILLLFIPFLIIFEYFWVHMLHPLLFDPNTYDILRPELVSFYIYSHNFFFLVILLVYLLVLFTLLILKFMIRRIQI